MNRLTVVIPSKTASNLAPCVAAVREHEPDARIIVVDDGIDWAQLGWLIREDLDFVSINGFKPFVFSRNVNIGIRSAGDSDVVVLNDDALLETPGGFSIMQRDAELDPRIGIIGATTNVTGQPLQMRRRLQPGAPSTRVVEHFAFICVLIPYATRKWLKVPPVLEEQDHLFTGGYLDERYCIDYGVEDRDYCEQVRAAGLRCVVHDGCYVDHSRLVSTFRGDPRAGRSFAQNWGLFKQKWGKGEL